MTESFDNFYKDTFVTQLNWHDKKATSNKKHYLISQIIISVFTIITPIVLAIGIIGSQNSFLIWSSVILAIIIAISNSLAKLFNFHENWINYRNVWEKLRNEDIYYKNKIHDYSDEGKDKERFVSKIVQILIDHHTVWSEKSKSIS